MARTNPLHLPRPTRQVVHRQVSQGENVSDFWFRALDTTEQFQALTLTKEKVKLYIDGDDRKPPIDFPPVGGEAVTGLSEDLLQTVAAIWMMQSDVDDAGLPVPDAPYTFEELVAMSLTLPAMWQEVMQLSSDVTRENSANLKNASREGSESTSVSPSATAKRTRS